MTQGKTAPVKLSDEEKLKFAKAAFEARKKDMSWKAAFTEANKILPADRRVGAQISSPNHLVWLGPVLKKIEQDEKNRVVVDHRHTLPKVDEESQAVATPKKERKALVRFNDEERRTFAEACLDIRKARTELTWPQIFREVNSMLPEHRRVGDTMAGPSSIKWLIPLMNEIAEERAKENAVLAAKPEPESPAPAAPPVFDLESLFIGALVNVAKQALPTLVQSPKFQNAMADVLMPHAGNQAAKSAESTPEKRKKVIVVGLLSVQTNEVQKELGYAFDFKFVGPNTPSQQVRDSAKNADIAILMTQFVSHKIAAAIRQHPGFIFCNGNSSALKNLLREKMNAQ